jgi:hypothetical protein
MMTMTNKKLRIGKESLEGRVRIFTKGGGKPSYYTYPLDEATFESYWQDKTEAAKYFKGVYVSVMLQRIAPAFQNIDFAAQDAERQRYILAMSAEAVSRIFPSRKVYDQFVKPAADLMEKGGKDSQGTELKPRQWESDDVGVLWDKVKTAISKLVEMFTGGQYTIMSPELYPVAADALLYTRALYQRSGASSQPEAVPAEGSEEAAGNEPVMASVVKSRASVERLKKMIDLAEEE